MTCPYTRHSDLGLAIPPHPNRRQDLEIKAGIIGLETDTIKYYCSELDQFRFCEIDSIAEDLARNRFAFIDEARGKIEVIIGDGRSMLEREWDVSGSQNCDGIALDIFSGNAGPDTCLQARRLLCTSNSLNGMMV